MHDKNCKIFVSYGKLSNLPYKNTKNKLLDSRVPLLDDEDDEEGELDMEDLLKLGDEDAVPQPPT